MPDLPPNPHSSTTFIPVSPWSRNGSEVTSPDQIDDDLKKWLRAAYDLDA